MVSIVRNHGIIPTHLNSLTLQKEGQPRLLNIPIVCENLVCEACSHEMSEELSLVGAFGPQLPKGEEGSRKAVKLEERR